MLCSQRRRSSVQSTKTRHELFIAKFRLKVKKIGKTTRLFSSVAQSCPTLCDPMNCSMPGLPVHHQLREFMQTRVQRIIDAIQPSHPLSFLLLLPPIPPSIRAFSNKSTLRMRWPKYFTQPYKRVKYTCARKLSSETAWLGQA